MELSKSPDRSEAPFNEVVKRYLEMTGDKRSVRADPEARYFGAKVERLSLCSHGRCAARQNYPRRLGQAQARDESIVTAGSDWETAMKTTIHALASLILLAATHAYAQDSTKLAGSKAATVTVVYQHELPNVPGKSIKGVLVEYGPGGYSPGHMHPKSAFIYATVLEGAIRSQVNDGPVTTYTAGQSWSEVPGDRH
jgi:quercetin dioxygenase-like cupin family protein